MTAWPRLSLRRSFRVVNGGTPTSDPANWEGDIPWATPVDLGRVNGGVLTATDRTLTETGLTSGSRMVPAGSLIVSTRAPIGYVAEAGVALAFNQGCRGLIPIAELDSRYFRYQLLAMAAELTSRGQGSTFVEISSDGLASSKAIHPPLRQQRAVADFLDAETARLDALIDKKRRMIQLLSQRIVAIGSMAAWGEEYGDRALCKAIGPVQRLPREWSVLRNKFFMREINDRSPDGLEELLSVSHLTGVTPRSQKDVTMFMAESLSGYKIVQPGDLVINTMWAWMGAAGVSSVAGIVSPAYGVYRFDQGVVLPAYYDILIRTPAYVAEMTRFSRGVWSSRLRLYPDEFLRLSAPVPPLDVQAEIAERVAAARSVSQRTIALLTHQIDLLAERRQALITAAVTGELDVAQSIAEEAS